MIEVLNLRVYLKISTTKYLHIYIKKYRILLNVGNVNNEKIESSNLILR